MINKTYQVNLTLEELKLLDIKGSEEAQKVIDKAKQEAGYGFELPIMNEILRKAVEQGKLTWAHRQIRSCSYCDKKYDYYTYPRSGRYHRKGDKNHNKPKYYSGLAFNESCVITQGYGDMCYECAERYDVIHKLIDYIIDNDLKVQIQDNDYKPSKYLKDNIRICFECGKEMRESEMGKLSTLMGDGYYKGKCHHCGAEELPIGRSHKSTNKFDFVENPKAREDVQNIKDLVKEYNKDEKILNFFQSQKDKYLFIIEEVEWKNGYRYVIRFNVKTKKCEVGFFYRDKADIFIDELKKYEYEISKEV